MKPEITVTREGSALEDLAWQFAYRDMHHGRRVLTTGGLSALEEAFDVLGWPDPLTVTDQGCEVEGCEEWAVAGQTVGVVYMRLCSEHSLRYFREGETTMTDARDDAKGAPAGSEVISDADPG